MISSDKATSKENRTTDMPETGAKEKSTEALEDAAAKKAAQLEVEARAIEEATATADAAYVPTPSLLSSPSPHPLLRQVDGPTLKGYSGKESVYQAKLVPIPLRGCLDVPIHIPAGGSVVEYKVETKHYDISFGIVAEREEGVTIVIVS